MGVCRPRAPRLARSARSVGRECCVGKTSRLKDLGRYLPAVLALPLLGQGQLLSAHSVPGTDLKSYIFSSVQFSSVVQSCPTFCDPMNRSSPGLPVHHRLPKFTQTHVHGVGDAIQPFHPLLSPSPPIPIPPSIRVFSNESTLRMRWLKYWSFSFSISPSNEYPGLISFRMDWLDLLAVRGTLKNLLQHHSSKASTFRLSAFFTIPTLTSIHDHWKNHSLD